MYKEQSDNQRNLKTKNVILALAHASSREGRIPGFVKCPPDHSLNLFHHYWMLHQLEG